MKSAVRKILSLALLAAYGGIALLGQGLHVLAPHAGHHHGLEVIRCSIHGDEHFHDHHDAECDHDHGPAGPAEVEHGGGLVVTSSECAAESHLCEICAFLFQLRSDRSVLTAAVDWQPVAVAAVSLPQRSYTPTIVGPHAPRGPPVLIG
jgi:hypothetical protein